MKKLIAILSLSILLAACQATNVSQSQTTASPSAKATPSPSPAVGPSPSAGSTASPSPALLDKKTMNAARQALEARLKANPNDPDAHYNLGHLFYQAGSYKEAVPELRMAIKQYPDDSDAHYVL